MSDEVRRAFIRDQINREGLGLEIGPGWSPLAPRSEGFNVEILDHATRDELIHKYRGSDIDPARIEEVDYIWKGQPFTEATGRRNAYDWIIASHVVEHTPDLIGFLNDCASALRGTGVLFLVIPDARFCFDHFRPLTGLARVIDAHEARRTRHSAGTAAEETLSSVTRGGKIGWVSGEDGEFALFHSPENVKTVFRRTQASSNYTDHHAWCFSPASFRLLIHDLRFLGLIEFAERTFHETVNFEFYVALEIAGCRSSLDRLEMLAEIRREIREADS